MPRLGFGGSARRGTAAVTAQHADLAGGAIPMGAEKIMAAHQISSVTKSGSDGTARTWRAARRKRRLGCA
jgi:hypothetical protein